jgi:hypothetical protein
MTDTIYRHHSCPSRDTRYPYPPPVPRIPRPVPRRLQKISRMTIALGVLALDGLVVAADTEESDGYLKTAESKIRVSSSVDSSAGSANLTPGIGVPTRTGTSAATAVAGAGTASYIDAVSEALWSPCIDHAHEDDQKLIDAIAAPLGTFYREHVVPFAAYPALERPDFELLIAATHRSAAPQNRHRLFVTDKTSIRRCVPYAAIGVGGMFARVLLKRLYPGVYRSGVGAVAALAAYVAFQVKESVPGCGKFTEIVVFQNGGRSYIRWSDVRDLESVFLEHASLESEAFASALAVDPAAHAKALKATATSFRRFRRAFLRLSFTKRWL